MKKIPPYVAIIEQDEYSVYLHAKYRKALAKVEKNPSKRNVAQVKKFEEKIQEYKKELADLREEIENW